MSEPPQGRAVAREVSESCAEDEVEECWFDGEAARRGPARSAGVRLLRGGSGVCCRQIKAVFVVHCALQAKNGLVPQQRRACPANEERR